MRNQFIYTEEITVPVEEGSEETKKIIVKHSFNVDCVTKAVTIDTDGTIMIFLDDLHERYEERPVPGRNGKVSMKREKDVFQTRIELKKEDADRFFELTYITETDNE
jgi:hypothetical protein